jgi:hypothetical protein
LRKIDFDPDHLHGERAEWFARWQQTAHLATEEAAAAVERDERPELKDDVWAKLKKWLFTYVFAEKCAYCEGKVTPQSFGDGEHWRPKNMVTEREGDRLVAVVDPAGHKHPGYWWLAYEWTNLLPACQKCNSGHGKNNQFPIDGDRVYEPGEVGDLDKLDDREKPFLLHPFRGADPARHLAFDDLGVVTPRDGSELGVNSIKVFNLARKELVGDRLIRVQEAEIPVINALNELEEGRRELDESLAIWTGPKAQYSVAIGQHVERRMERRIARLAAQLSD